jgi:hypothetical protein
MLFVAHTNQSRRHPDPRAFHEDRAVEEVVDHELATDFRDALGGSLVAQRPSLHAQMLGVDLRQRGRRFIGEAIRQVLVIRIVAEIDKRQNRHRHPIRRRATAVTPDRGRGSRDDK